MLIFHVKITWRNILIQNPVLGFVCFFIRARTVIQSPAYSLNHKTCPIPFRLQDKIKNLFAFVFSPNSFQDSSNIPNVWVSVRTCHAIDWQVLHLAKTWLDVTVKNLNYCFWCPTIWKVTWPITSILWNESWSRDFEKCLHSTATFGKEAAFYNAMVVFRGNNDGNENISPWM